MEWINSYDWSSILHGLFILTLQIIGVLVAFYIFRALGRKVIASSFSRLGSQKHMSIPRVKTLEKLTNNVFSYTLLFILITLIVGIFGLEVAPLIAGAGIIGLAIGFGAQGLVSDIVTGFFLLLEKQLDVDDYITAAGVDGVVEEVGLRTTHIRGFDGTLHFIPNREITSVSNHSRGNMRALVDISISYDDDIDHAITVLQAECDQIASENPTIVEGPSVLGVQSLGESDIALRIIAKTETMGQWAVERQLRKALKEVLDANEIEIPYPHQVYIDKRLTD